MGAQGHTSSSSNAFRYGEKEVRTLSDAISSTLPLQHAKQNRRTFDIALLTEKWMFNVTITTFEIRERCAAS